MVTKIVELYQQQLHFYNGNFDFYETEKAMRTELQQRAFENQQEYIRQQERFIERFRAKATKAAAAQSAIKRLDKLERIEDVSFDRPEIKINFQLDKIPGKIICTLKNVTKKFGDLTIVENTGAEINRGDKIALIGANGKGKSTLLRIIAGTESFEGERIWGHNVEESFYAQHQLEALNIQQTILDEMKHCGSQKTEQELRTLLGCFLFSGEDVDKKIKVLSGGEKARVALAKTIVSKANFLILDEPTNHLDLLSIDLLIEALNRYQGSLILVSHDRHFISKAANRIWEIDNHEIKDFAGGYEEWMQWKERKRAEESKQNEARPKQEKKLADEKPAEAKPKPVQKSNTPIDKEFKKELQKQQRNLQALEEKLATLTQQKKALEDQLALSEIYSDKNKFLATEAAYQKSIAALETTNREYETVFEKLMELEEKGR